MLESLWKTTDGTERPSANATGLAVEFREAGRVNRHDLRRLNSRLEAVCAVGSVEEVQVPRGSAQRDALLKKWSDAAANAGRAEKAGGATLLLLTFAAGGGGGAGGVSARVSKEENFVPNEIVTISGAEGGATIKIEGDGA